MKTDFKNIIIGAGPAGMFFGSNIKGKTLLLEKNDIMGKKLLLSGAGQCNFTHGGEISDFLNCFGKNGLFLKPGFYNFDNKKSIEFFKNNKIESIEREDGKVFPISLKAIDIRDALLKKIEENNVKIEYNKIVVDVSYNKELKFFIVKTKDKKYTTLNLIIATGGNSYQHTGSTGEGYLFAKKLGHSIEEISPCLVPINVLDYDFCELSGMSFRNIEVNLYRDNKKIQSNKDDLLFTHKNLSGPVILNISRYVKANDVLKINFVGKNSLELKEIIISEKNTSGKKLLRILLKELKLQKRFVEFIIENSKINIDKNLSDLNKKEINNIISTLTEYKLIVKSLGGYNIAMATSGGVSLKEINRKTMQSKLVDGLYFIGEVLDIDGNTGGYNIQAAFSTAFLAAKNINNKDL